VIATYLVHGDLNFHKKAQEIAVRLTVGTWTDLPKAKKNTWYRYSGKVIGVKVLNPDSDDLPKALLIIGYPLINMDPDIPSLIRNHGIYIGR
jgi:2,3-diketo-5-methylthiopentyl-1-phosphate enolase